jgi:heat shock protein HslJ
MRRRVLLSALIVALAGPALAADLPGANWLAVQAGAMALEAADAVVLAFGDGRIAGRSGCNRFMGAAELTALTPAAGRIALGPLAGTRMACIGRGDRVEAAVLAALGAVDGWRIDGDGTLVLTGGGADLLRARPN